MRQDDENRDLKGYDGITGNVTLLSLKGYHENKGEAYKQEVNTGPNQLYVGIWKEVFWEHSRNQFASSMIDDRSNICGSIGVLRTSTPIRMRIGEELQVSAR